MRVQSAIPRVLACAAIWVALTGARQPAYPFPDFILPSEEAFVPGQQMEVKPGDTILRGRVVRAMVVNLSAPIDLQFDRFAHQFQSGDELTPVMLEADKGKSQKLIYCGSNQRAVSKLTAVMIGDWLSKFETVVRFCFLDNDNDGKFEGYILGGAKDPAHQIVNPITPINYVSKELVPYEQGAEFSIVYRKYSVTSRKMHFNLRLTIDGEEQEFDYVNTIIDQGVQRNYATFSTHPKKVDYPMHFKNIAGANFGVTSVDADGTAQVKINVNFRPSMFKPISITRNVVFIYI